MLNYCPSERHTLQEKTLREVRSVSSSTKNHTLIDGINDDNRESYFFRSRTSEGVFPLEQEV